jgi:hypothetical protein
MKKPNDLFIDGSIFRVEEFIDGLYGVCGAGLNLSPTEVKELRDWLTNFLVWDTWDRSNTEKENND